MNKMRERNIALGYGYQSVEGRGTKPIISPEASNPQAKIERTSKTAFTYEANFIDSSEELQSELNAAFSLSTNLYNIGVDASRKHSRAGENNNYVSYYVVRMQWEKYTETIHDIPMINKITENEIANHASFYAHYGDSVITEVVYCETLVLVVEINKSIINKVQKFDNEFGLKAPITSNISADAKASISTIMSSLSNSKIADIKIYSEGNNSAGLQIQVLKELNETRQILEGFINKVDSTKNNSQQTTNEPKVDTSKNKNASSKPEEGKKKEEELERKQQGEEVGKSKETSGKNDNIYCIIKFITSSYLDALPKDATEMATTSSKRNYDTILTATDRAKKYVKALSKCRSRVSQYLNSINYLNNNAVMYNLNDYIKQNINDVSARLEAKSHDLDDIFEAIRNGIFLATANNYWIPWWGQISQIGLYLDTIDAGVAGPGTIHCPQIRFMDSAYLLGTIRSHYNNCCVPLFWLPLWYRRTNRDFIDIKVPYEAGKLLFKIICASNAVKQNTLKFDLIRKVSIHVSGNDGAHHTLYKGIMNGTVKEHLFPDMENVLSQSPEKPLPAQYSRLLHGSSNRKVYKNIGIANPWFELNGTGLLEKTEYFEVLIYGQTNSPLKPLQIDNIAPTGKANYDPLIRFSSSVQGALIPLKFASANSTFQRSVATSQASTPASGDENDDDDEDATKHQIKFINCNICNTNISR